jgi:MOSC domain-containing protein YiiM
MGTFEELEAAWSAGPPPPRARGTVRLVVRRIGGGAHESLAEALLTPEGGLEGDRWANSSTAKPDHQITLINARVAALVTAGRQPLDAPGDNLHVDLDIGTGPLPVGARLRAGEALLEVSEAPHTGCSKFAARVGPEALRWVNHPDHAARRLRGVNCRVVEGGRVRVGDPITQV